MSKPAITGTIKSMKKIKENSKTKSKANGELIFGMHSIIELLKAKRRRLIKVYTTRKPPERWDQVQKLLPRGIDIQYVDREVLNRLAGTTDHQNIIAWATPFVTRKKFFESKKQPFLLMLDGIQDPHNLGAILRSAYCTGVDGIIITEKRSAPINATAIKASAGLAEHQEIIIVSSAAHGIIQLKGAGYTPYLATINGKNALTITYEQPLCIVIGNEATGISKDILSSGVQVTLPQRTHDISYNASVAAGILLFLISELPTIKKNF